MANRAAIASSGFITLAAMIDTPYVCHTSIELPHDDAIRLRDYLNKAYPIEGVTPIKNLSCLDGTILGE